MKAISRRQFSATLGLLGAAQLLRAQPSGPLPPECLGKAPAGRVDIDVHCHVFNGTDLQVEKFLVHVEAGHHGAFLRRVVQALARPLQNAAWHWAPVAKKELGKLGRLRERPGRTVTSGQLSELYTDAVRESDKAYATGFAEELKTPEGRDFLKTYRAYLDSIAAKDAKARELIRQYYGTGELERLKEPEQLLAQLAREKELVNYSVGSVFTFVRGFFAYRFEQVYYLLHNYGCEHGTVQLIAPALVDYDYPLGAGKSPPPSRLPDQFEVMGRIAEVFQGRVLTYLPFDPWRVVFEGPHVFAALQEYVKRGAAVGVKL